MVEMDVEDVTSEQWTCNEVPAKLRHFYPRDATRRRETACDGAPSAANQPRRSRVHASSHGPLAAPFTPGSQGATGTLARFTRRCTRPAAATSLTLLTSISTSTGFVLPRSHYCTS